jgi:hypothetical protein
MRHLDLGRFKPRRATAILRMVRKRGANTRRRHEDRREPSLMECASIFGTSPTLGIARADASPTKRL